MSRVKYQHYVPRFYLEGFQQKSGKLWCYDKKTGKAFEQSPDRLGGETLFYDVPDADRKVGVSQFLEKWFNPLEGRASKTLCSWRDRLLTKRVFEPTAEEMWTMAVFMAVQMARTPRGRRFAVDAAVFTEQISFFNFLGEKYPELASKIENPLEELNISIPRDKWAYVHAAELMDTELHEEMAQILTGHIWLVTANETPWPYYTSDHPVIKVAHGKHPWRKMAGLRSPGVQIIYPLGPGYSLSLLERRFWKHHVPYHGQLVRKQLLKEHVDFDNSQQVSHAARFIYSRDENFGLAREMCRETPELRNPDHPELLSERGDQLRVNLDK